MSSASPTGSSTASSNPTARFLPEEFQPQMNGMDADEPHAKETEAIIGCAFSVLNALGHGFHEKPYENGLVVEFRHRGISFFQQPRYPLTYRGELVGEYVPDLTAFDKVVVDAKTIDRITDHEIGKMLNYLRVTGLQVGLILNFKHAKLQFRPVTLTRPDSPDLHS
ncbi:GxxExxY protein [Luteolibacter arcticus]|uniref:GxxExxY protein n=1 Tax=Luteolibacter arcticus TaxID=1581411 RepID=A0ABT3GI36_9BACT|nr:GxxExxY protein [Luteolibacter arcticus]MCW1923172.1 GxxExxY protein [Luteolibacter arcticus]